MPGAPAPGLYPGAGPGFPGAVPPVTGTVAGQVLARLSTRDLVISGITGSGLLAGLSIVGSSSTSSLLQRVFLGSSAAKIVRNSPVPVLVVP